MIVEFNQGVPPECIDWLWDNVGSGNVAPKRTTSPTMDPDLLALDYHLWKYERVAKPKVPESLYDEPFVYVPTITITDERMGMLFVLKWSS